jgi:hypothetical protein
MTHTRASTKHMSPQVGDLLVSNLRAPLLTLIEDTSPGTHDTLMAACDPLRYKELGVSDWEEHGSCAENLVDALRQLNQGVGLKGKKAVGADITVNHQPPPLNLFMNVPYSQDGELDLGSPKGHRGDRVKFRAERDVVVVMSACPQDITQINGGKPMVAHFVVRGGSEEDMKKANKRDKEAQEIIEKARKRMEGGDEEEKTVHTDAASTPKANTFSPSTTATTSGLPKFTPRSSTSSVEQRPRIVSRPPKLDHRSSSGIQRVGSNPVSRTPRSKSETPRKEPIEESSPMKRQPVPQGGRTKPRKLERRASAQAPKS